jgi:hypothetical protein
LSGLSLQEKDSSTQATITTMQVAAAAPAPPPQRRRVYTALDPRCEWKSTEEADTLVVDVSGNAPQLAVQLALQHPSLLPSHLVNTNGAASFVQGSGRRS